MKKFTDRDREIFTFIQDYYQKNGFSPSIREIGAGVYMSRTAVQRHLYKMVEIGYLTISPKTPRSIVLNIQL